jgi:hypothetical protein
MSSQQSEKGQSPLPCTSVSQLPVARRDTGTDEENHQTELVGAAAPPPLPPYSGPSHSSLPREAMAAEPSSTTTTKLRTYPGLPKIDYNLYTSPLFDLSADCTTLSTKAQYLSSSASALLSLIRSQASVPPKPQIRIVGKRGAHRVDFDLKVNLMGLLIPEDSTQRMDYIRCVGEGETAYRGGFKKGVLPDVGSGGLEEWCRRFVEDESQVKTFTLERVVANLDTEWIDGRLRSMIASTQYKGLVEITYPITHARVVVQTPDKVNKFFTTVTSFLAGKKRYEVVQSVWPFATTPKGEPSRKCIVQGEEDWWREWRDAIRHALSMRRVGWVTSEDRLEALMEGKGKGISSIDWEMDAQ